MTGCTIFSQEIGNFNFFHGLIIYINLVKKKEYLHFSFPKQKCQYIQKKKPETNIQWPSTSVGFFENEQS